MDSRDLLGLKYICDEIWVRFVDGPLRVLPVELFGLEVISRDPQVRPIQALLHEQLVEKVFLLLQSIEGQCLSKKLILVGWRNPRVLISAYFFFAFHNYPVNILKFFLNFERISDSGLIGGSIPHDL